MNIFLLVVKREHDYCKYIHALQIKVVKATDDFNLLIAKLLKYTSGLEMFSFYPCGFNGCIINSNQLQK